MSQYMVIQEQKTNERVIGQWITGKQSDIVLVLKSTGCW